MQNECELEGHDWQHVPLSDYRDCKRCGEVFFPTSEDNAQEDRICKICEVNMKDDFLICRDCRSSSRYRNLTV